MKTGILIDSSIIAYLIALFLYPANSLLPKFLIAIYFYIVLCFCIIGICWLLYLLKPQDLSEDAKENINRTVIGIILDIIIMFLLMLNGLAYCFVVYALSFVLGIMLCKIIKGE